MQRMQRSRVAGSCRPGEVIFVFSLRSCRAVPPFSFNIIISQQILLNKRSAAKISVSVSDKQICFEDLLQVALRRLPLVFRLATTTSMKFVVLFVLIAFASARDLQQTGNAAKAKKNKAATPAGAAANTTYQTWAEAIQAAAAVNTTKVSLKNITAAVEAAGEDVTAHKCSCSAKPSSASCPAFSCSCNCCDKPHLWPTWLCSF